MKNKHIFGFWFEPDDAAVVATHPDGTQAAMISEGRQAASNVAYLRSKGYTIHGVVRRKKS